MARILLHLIAAVLLAASAAFAAEPPVESFDEATARLGTRFDPAGLETLHTAEGHWAPAAGWCGDVTLALSADVSYPTWHHEFELDGELVALRWVFWPYAKIAAESRESQVAAYTRLAELVLDRFPNESGNASITDAGETTETGMTYLSANGRRVTLEWEQGVQLRLTVETEEYGEPHSQRIFDEQMREAVAESSGDEYYFW
jgi:hypothetical protein